jgi:NTE family protein
MTKEQCDVVLEGGGVKGTALVGALVELTKAGYTPQRVAGTSAGAIVGSLLAAGMQPTDMVSVMQGLDYRQFRDESPLDKLGIPGKLASLAFTKGLYEGNYLLQWLSAQLETLGVKTFADLKLTDDWAQELPANQRYKLVVIVSDVSRGRLVRLPWDYAEYGLDPDEQLVADAVRASMSIPYFYQPAKLGKSYLVDGGLLSNFPISIFDDHTSWPTFGIKLSARADALTKMNPVTNPVDYSLAILATATNAHDSMHVDDPCTQMRTIFVDTFDIKATDFDISKADQARLLTSGREHAKAFLKDWDFAKYKHSCPVVS